MIKVRFLSNISGDVSAILMSHLKIIIDIEDWILEHIEGISFHCMDYPYDMEFCYDCYFQSDNDKIRAQNIYNILQEYFSDFLDVSINIWIVDEKLDEINEVGRL